MALRHAILSFSRQRIVRMSIAASISKDVKSSNFTTGVAVDNDKGAVFLPAIALSYAMASL